MDKNHSPSLYYFIFEKTCGLQDPKRKYGPLTFDHNNNNSVNYHYDSLRSLKIPQGIQPARVQHHSHLFALSPDAQSPAAKQRGCFWNVQPGLHGPCSTLTEKVQLRAGGFGISIIA